MPQSWGFMDRLRCTVKPAHAPTPARAAFLPVLWYVRASLRLRATLSLYDSASTAIT